MRSCVAGSYQMGGLAVTTRVHGPRGTSSASTNRQSTVPEPSICRARAKTGDRSMPARNPKVFFRLGWIVARRPEDAIGIADRG
jgi:hypothetical protein